MSTVQIAANIGTFHPTLALDRIVASKTNPRKHFDAAELAELSASIKEKGVIEPIIVRPHSQKKDHWELVAGERRWRASKDAGVETIPAIERDLDDKSVLEIQVIENLQRADVHPLDEANGYRQLLSLHGYDVETLAAKVGKSASYVYQRLKLADLIPAAQKLFFDQVINAGHAILIARLNPDEQKEVIAKEGRFLWTGYGEERDVCSVRDLSREIRRSLYLDLKNAAWKLNDTKLVPAAGPCTACPKRTGANPGLFDDINEKNICTDRSCYNLKLEAFMKREIEAGGLIKISTEYSAGKTAGVLPSSKYREIDSKENRCKFTQKAIVVEGYGRGATKDVCIDKTCKKHHPPSALSGLNGGTDYRAQEKKKQAKRLVEMELRKRIFVAVLEKAPKKLERADLELIAKTAWKRQQNAIQRLVLKAFGGIEEKKDKYGSFECDKPAFAFIEKASDAELVKFMLATALGPELDVSMYSDAGKATTLLSVAKRLKVNADKITKDFAAEQKAKPKKKSQTSAKSKSKAADPEDDTEEDPEMDERFDDDEDPD